MPFPIRWGDLSSARREEQSRNLPDLDDRRQSVPRAVMGVHAVTLPLQTPDDNS